MVEVAEFGFARTAPGRNLSSGALLNNESYFAIGGVDTLHSMFAGSEWEIVVSRATIVVSKSTDFLAMA